MVFTRATRTLFGVVLLALAVTPAAFAHHSAAATYEGNHTIEIRGTIVRVSWTNPHCHLYIAAADGPFKGQTYTVELGSPSVLVESGWTKSLVKPGDTLVIHVNPSRSGAPIGLCRDCAMTVNGKAAPAAPQRY
jgi:hypothetical protein